MIKGVICVVCAVVFLIINTVILFLKPEFKFAVNDDKNYCVFFQKWIETTVFMGTIIISLFSIYFAVNYRYFVSLIFITLECLLVIIYALVKYKGITVNCEDIKVQRLFCKDINTKFSSINKVTYIPNAKLVVKLKNRKTFDVSFNSENFHKFYSSLIKKDIKFKTGKVPNDENHVYLSSFNISILFPKTMFREYYESNRYLRNSKYLFSARSLENHEYIEGYLKESDKDIKEFTENIKTDLEINDFKPGRPTQEMINGLKLSIIKCVDNLDKKRKRIAYIYKDEELYLVIYCDYNKENENIFITKMNNSIKETCYEDTRSRLARV